MDISMQKIASRDMVLAQASTLSDTAFLGYGYDVTGLYCHPSGVRANVIDIVKFIENESSRFERKVGSSSDTKVVAAENAMEYCSKLTAKLDLDVTYKKVFSGALSLKFDYKNSCSSKYSFASFFLIMRKAMVSLVADASDLQPYLSAQFLKDISKKSPEALIHFYGTHVMTNITLGGRLEVLCRSIIEDTNKAYSIEVGVKASVKKIANITTDTSYDESTVTKNKELTVNIETIGGDPSKCMIDSFDYTKASSDLKSNFASWQNSLSNDNMTLVDMEKGSLICIADLIPDDPAFAQKKKELAAAVDKYLSENQFNMVDEAKPLYRYYCPILDDHFYTMNKKELGYGNGNYSLERIECMIYDVKMPHSIPLYRYYNDVGDHLYTVKWDELQNGKNGYKFEGISGYVFASNESDASLVPLYRSYKTATVNKQLKMDHCYSLDKSEFVNTLGYHDEGVMCYVKKPTDAPIIM